MDKCLSVVFPDAEFEERAVSVVFTGFVLRTPPGNVEDFLIQDFAFSFCARVCVVFADFPGGMPAYHTGAVGVDEFIQII